MHARDMHARDMPCTCTRDMPACRMHARHMHTRRQQAAAAAASSSKQQQAAAAAASSSGKQRQAAAAGLLAAARAHSSTRTQQHAHTAARAHKHTRENESRPLCDSGASGRIRRSISSNQRARSPAVFTANSLQKMRVECAQTDRKMAAVAASSSAKSAALAALLTSEMKRGGVLLACSCVVRGSYRACECELQVAIWNLCCGVRDEGHVQWPLEWIRSLAAAFTACSLLLQSSLVLARHASSPQQSVVPA